MPKKKEKSTFLSKQFNPNIKLFLILASSALLFVALFFSMNYLNDNGVKQVKADILKLTEDFSSDTYFDSAKSSGVWDTTLGQAYLPSNVWAGISEEYVGYDSLTGFPADSVRQQFVLDSNNNAYLVWQDYAEIIQNIYFSKFIAGQGWLKMDNTPGYETIGVGSVPLLYLDPNEKVYIIWGVWGPEYKVQITKWTEGIGWSKMDGTPGIETIYTNTEGGGDPRLQFDKDNRPMVTFPGYNRLLFTRWNGSMWTKMNGTSGYDDLFEGGMNLREFAIDEFNNPYIAWEGFDRSDPFNYYQTINFTKWNGSTWTGADGMDRDGDPNTFENDVLIKLPDMADNLFPQVKVDNNNPLVSWVRGKVYFSKWNGSTWTGADNIDDDGNPSTYDYDVIDPGADFVSEHNMQFDLNHYPVIVFSESLNNDIALTRWNGVTWTGVDKIDGDDNPSTFEYDNVSNTLGWSMGPNFVIDSADKIHVVWLENVDNSNVYIYFTYWDGTKWAKLSEDVAGKEELFSGIYPSANPPNIKLDSESNPYVFFDSWRGSVGGIYVTKMVTDYIRNASVFSLNVNQTSDYVSIASLKPSENLFGQSINYFLSNNGGATWTSVLPNLPYFLPSVGNDLRWKADFHTDNKKITPQLLGLNIINKTTDFACWVDDPISMGTSGKIYAKINFPATQVRARIVKDNGDIIRDNIILTTSNNTDYNGVFSVNYDMYFSRNIVVLATDTATNQQTFCNASTGRVWKQVLNQNLSQTDRKADLLSFNNKLWLIGGIKNNVLTNDVYSSVDGQNWICEWGNSVSCNHPAPGWSARWGNKLVVYNNNIWLIGGCVSYDSTFSNCAAINRKNDVWSFDGNTWLLKTGSANFSSRFEMAAAEYDNKMWVLGGRDDNNLNDVWYSTDGISWTSAPMANWPGRYGLNAVNYDNGSGNRLWVIGGMDNGGSKTDVWSANDPSAIDNWQQITSNGGWGSRYGYNFINYDERLLILGGCDVSGVFNGSCNSNSYLNDIWWSIDGENWAQIIPTQAWPARFLASAGIFNNHIYIRAGQAASGPLNDLWQSDYGYFSFKIRESGGSFRYPEPSNFMCKGMTNSSITWSFKDNTSDEEGFILYNIDSQRISSVNKVINSQNLSEIIESNLSANTLYRGFVTAYKSTMESAASNTVNCYTLANNPQAPIITPAAAGVNIIINRSDGNPDYTEYALFEYYSNKYVQPDSTLGTEAYWAKYQDWGGAVGINVPLTGSYKFYILAKNVAGKISGYNAAALNLDCKAQSPTEIEWQMSAPSSWEMDGFNLYKQTSDQVELAATIATAGSKLYNYTEVALQPNRQYSRYFKTYKVVAGQRIESEASISATCYTRANEPLPVIIGEIKEDSVQIILNNLDGNPPETLYALYEAKSGKYVQADGSLGVEPFWQTYAQWGGASGIYVTILAPQVQAQVSMNALLDLNQFEFSAIVKNGDNIITIKPTKTSLSSSKGIAVNQLARTNTFLGKIAAASNSSESQSVALRLIREFSVFLNLILVILAILLAYNLYSSYKYLNLNPSKKLKYLFSIFWQEPAILFSRLAGKDRNGSYELSYHKHKVFHHNSQKLLQSTAGILIIKGVVLAVMIFGLVGLQYAGNAQDIIYRQDSFDIKVGDKLSYIIRFNNDGQTTASSVVVSDLLDPNLIYIENSAKVMVGGNEMIDSLMLDAANPGMMVFNVGDLNAGQAAAITFDATVRDSALNQSIVNEAQISGANFDTQNTNKLTNNVITEEIILEKKEVEELIKSAEETAEALIFAESAETTAPMAGALEQPSGQEVNISVWGSILKSLTEDVSKTEVIGNILTDISQNQTVKTIVESAPVKFAEEKVLNNPVVEQASQDVVTPTLVTVAVINTAPAFATASLNFWSFLHFIFVEPFLILFRKKRKNWGVVYDSLTKMPISLALVRLYRKEDRQLVQTRVTDREGRYLIMVKDPGIYYLEVTKPNYDYPSKILSTEKMDNKYIDLYHGEELTIQDKEAAISANIPLDVRDVKVKPISAVIRRFALQNLKNVISYVGLILAILVLIIYPSAITILALIFHLIFYVIFKKLLVPARPKGWGIIYDQENKQALNNVVVRLFDIKYNKLLETQLTDNKGRYAFLVGRNVYQMMLEKDGYQTKEVKPVDLTTAEQIVNLDIPLVQESKAKSPEPPVKPETPEPPANPIPPDKVPPKLPDQPQIS